MVSQPFSHVSVMPGEVLQLLAPRSGEVYLDGTLGGGGHSRLILEASSPDGRLIGLDRDPAALASASVFLLPFGERAILRSSNFSDADQVLETLGIAKVDGILLDLGVSSHQLDTAQRGFSFRTDGPLDMRMDPTSGETAAEVVNTAAEEDLARIFRDYGEERWARRIARAIVKRRSEQPFATTRDLANLIEDAVPASKDSQRIHPATRSFQGLRIFVNDELGHLQRGLSQAIDLLAPGGRLAVISFHSLEDRIVKHMFQDAARGCICPPRLPVCCCGVKPKVELLTRKGLRPTEAEVAVNPRARSAVLRGVRRIG